MARLQNEDFKTSAELVSAGGTSAQLLNDSKIYVTANSLNKTLSDAIVAGDIGGGVKAWAATTAYVTGDIVTYEKAFYTCISSHTSAATFEPDYILAYWHRMDLPQVAKNYMAIANNFESNTVQGWTVCKSSTMSLNFPTAVGSSSNPFSSSNGGTTATTAQSPATTSSNPLSGSYSLNFTTNSSGTTAGDMYISPAIPIDIVDQAKVLSFKFAYKLVSDSGSVTNFSGTSSNTFGVAIYDVTNNAWIQPAGVFNLVQKTGVGVSTGTFQTAINTTKLQIAVYCANTNASSTISLYLDEFYLGSQPTTLAPAVSDWQTYTMTLGGGLTVTNKLAWYRRVGDTMELKAYIGPITANGSGVYTFSLPSGLSIDTSSAKMQTIATPNYVDLNATANTYGEPVGWATINTQGNTWYMDGPTGGSLGNAQVYVNTTTNLVIVGGASGVTSNRAQTFGSNSNIASVSGTVQLFARIPIVGWSSNTVSSSDTDTRVIAFSAYRTTNTAALVAATDTLISFPSIEVDTAGAWNSAATSDTYTVPVSGNYRIAGGLNFNSGTATAAQVKIYINGSLTNIPTLLNIASGSTNNSCPFDIIKSLKAGDTIKIYGWLSPGSTGVVSSDSNRLTHLNIERISGPAVVQATESVNMRALKNTGSHTNSGNWQTLASWNSSPMDSHGSFNITSGEYTFSVSGKFLLTANVGFLFNATGARSLRFIFGSEIYYGAFVNTVSASFGTMVGGSVIISVLAGQKVTLEGYQNSGGNLGYETGLGATSFSITRVGN